MCCYGTDLGTSIIKVQPIRGEFLDRSGPMRVDYSGQKPGRPVVTHITCSHLEIVVTFPVSIVALEEAELNCGAVRRQKIGFRL